MKTLLALLLSLHAWLQPAHIQQVNPPGVSVLPSQAAFYDTSGSGSTVAIEVHDQYGATIPLVDSIGTKWPAVVITVPASTAVGLGYEITQTAPDSIHFLKSLSTTGQYSVVAKVLTGGVTENGAGTFDSSVGNGNGIATTLAGPSSTSPLSLSVGAIYQISQGNVVSALNVPVSASLTGSLPAGTNALGTVGYTAQAWQPASWTSATSTGTNISVNATNMTTGVVSVNVPSGITGGQLEFSGYDGVGWFHLPGSLDGSNSSSNLSAVNSPFTLVGNTQSLIRFPIAGLQQFRINLKTAITGSGTVTVRLGASAGPAIDRVTVVSSSALPTGAAQETGGNLATLAGAVSASKVNINAASLPLPTNGAQETGGNLATLGGTVNSTLNALRGLVGFLEGTESVTSSVQSATTSWATLTTNGGSALGTSRLGVHIANTGNSDVWIATTSGSPRFVVPAGVDRFISVKGGITLYFATLSGTSNVYATEFGF